MQVLLKKPWAKLCKTLLQ